MLVQIADFINCILQSIMYVLTINYCLDNKYKGNRKGLIISIIVTWISIQGITIMIGNTSLSMILHRIALMTIFAMLFDKDIIGVTIGYGIIGSIVAIVALVCGNLFFGYIQPRLPAEYLEIGTVIFVYLPHYILTVVVLKNLDKIYKIYRTIRTKNLSIIMMTIAIVTLDFIVSFDILIHDRDNPMFKSTLFVLLGCFIVGITIYFANLEKKMREIAMLNSALDEKINELKKVKHDYGAQISYLYGLHLMNRHERIGELLKDIINGNDSIAEAVQVANDSDSVISVVTNGIVHKGINVVVDEQADLEELEISEMELQRIISNIINNAVTAMDYNGIVTVRTYYNFNDVVIKIQNNGPKIEDNIIKDIFIPGFSTKNDKHKDHGFGLAIVKEIIEKHKGEIEVKSSEKLTEFIIKLPICA